MTVTYELQQVDWFLLLYTLAHRVTWVSGKQLVKKQNLEEIGLKAESISSRKQKAILYEMLAFNTNFSNFEKLLREASQIKGVIHVIKFLNVGFEDYLDNE